MTDIGGSQSESFGLGISHQVNPGRSNLGSITLNGSSEQSAVGPHAVLAASVGGGSQDDDGNWQQTQRLSGGYAPGSMATFQDRLDQGTNDNID